MSFMFYRVRSVLSLDLANWDMSSVENMGYMFHGTWALTHLDASNWDTSNVVNMRSMFSDALGLVYIDASGWDTSSVRDMTGMFSGAINLKTLDVSGWDTSNVVSMDDMFNRAISLTYLDVSNWDTGNVSQMARMFSRASSLTRLDLSGWDTRAVYEAAGSVWHMGAIFYGTTNLQELVLGEKFIYSPGWSLLGEALSGLAEGPWQNVGRGSAINPWGEFALNGEYLIGNFNGAIHADTWVRDAVPPNDWAHEYIEHAFDLDFLSPRVLNTHWRDSIPRIYIADLAARFIEVHYGESIADFVASRDPNTLYSIPFTDSTDPDVLALAQLGVIRGASSYRWEGVQFRPYDLIDRQSAAVLLGRLVALFDGEVPTSIAQDDLPFQDTIPSWARGSVHFLYHQTPRIMSNTSSQPSVYLFSPQMQFQTQMMVIAMVRTLDVLS